MNSAADRIRHLDCGCRQDSHTGIITNFCPAHTIFQNDIDTANQIIGEWAVIARSIARQCHWRRKGQCLIDCLGGAVCNLDGLTLVDESGAPVVPREINP
jgi:hypothetical protein